MSVYDAPPTGDPSPGPAYPPPGAPYAPPQNSTLAIVALVAGILGLTILPIIGSIAAVILAPMARREIAESRGALTGEGLVTAANVLGWIGIVLLVLGACAFGVAILVPLCLVTISSSSSSLIAPILLSWLF